MIARSERQLISQGDGDGCQLPQNMAGQDGRDRISQNVRPRAFECEQTNSLVMGLFGQRFNIQGTTNKK